MVRTPEASSSADPDRQDTPRLSVVIPVYNSEAILPKTIERTIAYLESTSGGYELILVNDASPDDSWSIIEQAAAGNPHILAIDLLRNYGQHTAIFCGLQHSRGDYVVTMDDDLQNPPEEIDALALKADEGYDVVYGQFRRKEHSTYRRFGSRIIDLINQRIFHKPPDLVVTNFRYIRRDVVDRMCTHRTFYPYITGLSLMFSGRRANTWVDHQARAIGKSNYNLRRIATLVMRILFNYSSFPLHVMSGIGYAAALISFPLGAYFLIRALFIGTSVPGWATTVILVSFLGGLNIALSSMLGEYLIRLIRQVSEPASYHIRQTLP